MRNIQVEVNGAILKVSPIYNSKKKGYDYFIFLDSIGDTKVNAKPIRKYGSILGASNFINAFIAMSEDEQVRILAEKVKDKKKDGVYHIVKVQYVQIFRVVRGGKPIRITTTFDKRVLHDYAKRYNNLLLKEGAQRWAKIHESVLQYIKIAEVNQNKEFTINVRNKIAR